jgi:hypothetical protein
MNVFECFVLHTDSHPLDSRVLDGVSVQPIIDASRSYFASQFYEEQQRFLCRDVLVYLNEVCARAKLPFVDGDFLPDLNALYCPQRDISKYKKIPREWRRLSDIYPNATVFGVDVSGDLEQGDLGDCW